MLSLEVIFWLLKAHKYISPGRLTHILLLRNDFSLLRPVDRENITVIVYVINLFDSDSGLSLIKENARRSVIYLIYGTMNLISENFKS